VRRLPAGAAALVVAATALAGCGIRATNVPVDAGPAPDRVSCTAPRTPPPSGSADLGDKVYSDLYLLCGQRVSPVRRAVPGPLTGHLATARALLAELKRKPDAAEENSGFATEVPGDITADGPAGGDPPETLRLGQDPRELPSYVLAQLVCTFAGTAAGGQDLTVVLGGPPAGGPARRYRCDETLRSAPDAGATAGTSL
jgi:hypothetical protein